MTRKALVVISIAPAAVLLGGILYILAAIKQPLDEPLALEGAPSSEPVALQESGPVRNASATGEPAVTPQTRPQGTCGESGQIDLLVTGLGDTAQDPPHGSDWIRLVHVDFDNPRVRMLAVPRELYVDTPALEGIEGAELKWVYPHVEKSLCDQPQKVVMEKGTQVLAQTLLDNFGYAADHYITLDEPSFTAMVDMIGGIDINLPVAVDGTRYGQAAFPAGEQHLTGAQILELFRVIDTCGAGNDWGERFDLQDLVLTSLLATARQPAVWAQAPKLVKGSRKLVTTDLSIDQLLSLVCMVEETAGSAEMLAISPQMTTTDLQGRLIPDRQAIEKMLEALQAP